MRTLNSMLSAHHARLSLALLVLAAVAVFASVRALEAHAREPLSSGEAIATPEPQPVEELRNCDGTTSTYTPDDPTGNGSSSGADTINQAMQEALWDALYKAAKAQFKCKTCDGESQPCPKIDGSADSAGAVMSDPVNDCTKDQSSGLWSCSGEVTFQVGGAPEPSADAGCEDCDESEQATTTNPQGR